MAAKEISVKTYVVRLSGEERQQLETLDPIGHRRHAITAVVLIVGTALFWAGVVIVALRLLR